MLFQLISSIVRKAPPIEPPQSGRLCIITRAIISQSLEHSVKKTFDGAQNLHNDTSWGNNNWLKRRKLRICKLMSWCQFLQLWR